MFPRTICILAEWLDWMCVYNKNRQTFKCRCTLGAVDLITIYTCHCLTRDATFKFLLFDRIWSELGVSRHTYTFCSDTFTIAAISNIWRDWHSSQNCWVTKPVLIVDPIIVDFLKPSFEGLKQPWKWFGDGG